MTTATEPPGDPGAVLRRLAHLGGRRPAASPAAAARELDLLRQLTHDWLPTARDRRADAAGSPSDSARWDALLAAAQVRTDTREQPLTRLLVHLSGLRELLRAILDSTPPHTPVAVLAAQVRTDIRTGVHPPGAPLPLADLAEVLGVKTDRVRLAITDLLAEGTVVRSRGGYRVPDPASITRDLPQQIAALLRDQITAGVYTPGTALPRPLTLAGTLAVGPRSLPAALRILTADGLLAGDRRPHVSPRLPAPPEPVPIPVSPGSEIADPDPGLAEIVGTARTWWRNRQYPDPGDLNQCLTRLQAAAAQLLHRTPPDQDGRRDRRQEGDPALHRRAAYLLSAAPPVRADLRTWHTACLAVAVAGLLNLPGAAPPHRPAPR
ncbi:GntR family transcriptional regulator [Streptomyces sp. NPDC001889]